MKKEKMIVIVDDHQIIRDGLRLILENNSLARVLGEAGSAADAYRVFESLPEIPSAAIIDISLPDIDGISLVRELHGRYPSVALVMYTMHVSVEYVQSALEAGAMAYVSKSSPSKELLLALESVWAGNPYLDSLSLKMHLARTVSRPAPVSAPCAVFCDELTMQENRVYRLAIRNFSNARIAEELDLREKTVQNYVSNIYQKLQVKDRFELIEFSKKVAASQ
jgi:DNA-binding NarL/FixJ family response regulator